MNAPGKHSGVGAVNMRPIMAETPAELARLQEAAHGRLKASRETQRAIELVTDRANNPREMAERMAELDDDDLRLVIKCTVLDREVRDAARSELERNCTTTRSIDPSGD